MATNCLNLVLYLCHSYRRYRFSRVIKGFDDIAQISNRYQIAGVTDQIIYSLGKISTLTYGNLSVPLSTIEMTTDANEKIVVSELSVQFGEDFKAQLASIILFRIAKSNSSLFPKAGHKFLFSLPIFTYILFFCAFSKLAIWNPTSSFCQTSSCITKGQVFKRRWLVFYFVILSYWLQ